MRTLAFLALLVAGPAYAQVVPDTLPHQGRVFDNTAPLDGSFSVRFALYRVAVGGTPVWTETKTIEFDEGYYSTHLGDAVEIPQDVLDGGQVYLGIKVGTVAELPRLAVSSAPYARRSMLATNADGDITPNSVTVGSTMVIDSSGRWIGDTAGMEGPPGDDADPDLVAAALAGNSTFISALSSDLATSFGDDLQGPQGIQGPPGPPGSEDDGEAILAKLAQVAGSGSGLDADQLDGMEASAFFSTGQDVLTALLQVDGVGSGLDADTVGGATVQELTDSITTTIENTISVSGIEGSDRTMAVLVHATASGGARSVKVAGTEGITFANNDGLAMVVIDRDTYDIVSTVNSIPVTRNFDVNNASTGLVQWATFIDAKSQLVFADHLVVLASRGPIDRYMYTSINGGPAPADLLDDFGADVDELDLGPEDAFALVGYPDIGRGNGISMAVDTTSGSRPTADLAAIVMDGLLSGIGSDDDVISRVGRRDLQCDATNEGVLTYDAGVFRGCDGTHWNYLGGDRAHQTWDFTNCGQTGRLGPNQSQCNGQYSGTTLDGDVTVSSGFQLWTVPETGRYRISTYGASGADGSNDSVYNVKPGGHGAYMSGTFELTEGDVLKILVGQQGVRPGIGSYGHQPGGGGGGTFVAMSNNNSPLIVAGGGGAGGTAQYGQEFGGHGRIETSGESVYDSGSYIAQGGTNGGGGGIASRYSGSGAGFTGNGTYHSSDNPISRAMSFVNGGAGGQARSHAVTAHGGFGGGGYGELCGGGGGGYSGGGAACGWSSYGRSGGGGSYNIGSRQENLAGENFGHGRVRIVRE